MSERYYNKKGLGRGEPLARPKKCRNVCALPKFQRFEPSTIQAEESIVLTVDEYEAIRWIDLEGFTQEQCARQMQVARTTVQAIYTSARTKLAKALVHGKTLKIKGGSYQLCQAQRTDCTHNCPKRTRDTSYREDIKNE